MEFFDKKEDVMETVLTPYGRYKLSRGQLNPTFYAFYDDDVIYDNKYGNAGSNLLPFTELQNETEGRIQEDTPKLKPIRSRTSVEDEINTYDEMYERAYTGDRSPATLERIQPLRDQLYGLKYPLASADPYSSNYPAWDVEFLQAKMTGSQGDTESFTTYMKLTGTFSPPVDGTKLSTDSETREIQLEPIPQLKSRGQYQTYLDIDEDFDDSEIYMDYYDEGSIILEEDFLLLKVEEKNTEFLLKNFDVELFAIDYTYKSNPLTGKPLKEKEILIPLPFDGATDANIIASDLFDISFDEKIPNQIICRYINDQSQGVFSDMLVDCGDLTEESTDIDVYSGLIDGEGEVC